MQNIWDINKDGYLLCILLYFTYISYLNQQTGFRYTILINCQSTTLAFIVSPHPLVCYHISWILSNCLYWGLHEHIIFVSLPKLKWSIFLPIFTWQKYNTKEASYCIFIKFIKYTNIEHISKHVGQLFFFDHVNSCILQI